MPRPLLKTIISGLLLLALAAAPGCRSDQAEEVNPIAAFINWLRPTTPRERWAGLAEKLRSPDPDLRREAVLMMGQPGYREVADVPELLSIMATGDPDDHVRASAVEVLSRVDTEGLKLRETLESTHNDASPRVRLAVVTALQRYPHHWGLPLLIARVNDDSDITVRGAAAAALSHYRDRRALRALVTALGSPDFEVAFQARGALRAITGEDFEYDQQLWQNWLADHPHAPLAAPS